MRREPGEARDVVADRYIQAFEIEMVMRSCMSDGMIQCIMDGECPRSALPFALQHLSVCEFCAATLRKARREEDLLFLIFSANATVVPSDILWTRLVAALDLLRQPRI